MTEAKQPAVFVDGNNVMGSRADGWWRNRAEAAERLVAEIAPLARDSEAAWTIVFDGPGPPGMAPPRECLTVVHILPSLGLPPVVYCRGTSPSQAAEVAAAPEALHRRCEGLDCHCGDRPNAGTS